MMADECNLYSDDSDGSFNDLPAIVNRELDRRKAAEKAGTPIEEPADPVIMTALRERFQHGGGSPAFAGGYIDLCEELGVTPSSTDPLVKRPEYNIWYLGRTGEDTPQWWRKRIEAHEGRVRLIRYREFIKEQKRRGFDPPSGWILDGKEGEALCGDAEVEEDSNQESTLPNENDPDEDVIVAFAEAFTNQFYSYVNRDKLNNGLAVGLKGRPETFEGTDYRQYRVDCSLKTLLEQCRELEDRYRQLRRPLGPSFSDVQPPVPGSSQSHASAIRLKIGLLFQTTEASMAPNWATASLLERMTDMLEAAVNADMDLARAVLDHRETLLRLRKNALDYAIAADIDLTRPTHAASAWWRAFESVTSLTCSLVRILVHGEGVWEEMATRPPFDDEAEQPMTSDGKRAIRFYEEKLEPELFSSMQSEFAAEKLISVVGLERVILALPHARCMHLVKRKETWKLLETLCAGKDHRRGELNRREERREKENRIKVAACAIHVLRGLAYRGMTIEPLTGTVKSGRLVHKMVERGIVPLLISLAQSPHDQVSVEAINMLAQISRVKDCRLLIFQDPNSVLMIREMLTSSNGSKVSSTMLLIVHLLWDQQWRDILLEFEDPSLEKVAVTWAAFCMKLIRSESYAAKARASGAAKELSEIICEKIRGGEGSMEYAQGDIKLEELQARRANEPGWSELESADRRQTPVNSLLGRCLILSSQLVCVGVERIKRAGVLHLATCCLDLPADDHHRAAASIFQNCFARKMMALAPASVPDPDHVIRSLLTRLERFADDNTTDKQVLIFSQVTTCLNADPLWRQYFDRLASESEEHRFTIQRMLPIMGSGVLDQESRQDHSTAQVDCFGPGDSGPCGTLTGRLGKCSACGKIEGKKGDLRKCARCRIARYCDRDCQVSHWKQHKKDCIKQEGSIGQVD